MQFRESAELALNSAGSIYNFSIRAQRGGFWSSVKLDWQG